MLAALARLDVSAVEPRSLARNDLRFDSSSGMRYARQLIAAGLCLAVVYFATLGVLALRSGLSWREMDFDHSGTTSIGEFFTAADVGTRPVRRDGQACTEFFLLKDGSPVKVLCPTG